ncbi:gamma-glutamyltransferase family protein [Bradyrhizobium iriomotense]|uniref:gamma-glutamyltransferase family protein n=1 Tax=Bradyrhizobium iriomotense TaxID=441950 RepID=UPI001B8A7575|nr:gamma-glutamyltransferase [Bradyrhizobium iriomotense]
MNKGIVVAEQPDAVEVGARILMAGGNAVDAAVACAFAQGVVDQMNGGVAGYGCAQVYFPARGIHDGLSFLFQAPAAVVPGMWSHLLERETPDGFGFVLKGYVNDFGYQSIAVPGAVKGWYDLQRRYGVLPWGDVVEPALRLAVGGYRITPAVREQWFVVDDAGRADNIHRLRQTRAYAHLFFAPDGSALKTGTVVRNADYGATLATIARDGAAGFHAGRVADAISQDMERNGGLLGRVDLETYEAEPVTPLWGDYRGHKISVLPPPTSGAMLLRMLRTLEHFDLRSMGHNTPDYIATVAEVMKRAQLAKETLIGDPRHDNIDPAAIFDPAICRQEADEIKRGERVHIERVGDRETKTTTHVSVMDRDGNAVTMTHSLGAQSGVLTPGLGFMYNGAIGMFDPRPGNSRSLEPHRRRVTSMTPAMVFAGNRLRMLLGAPGGSHIPMGILQVILNVLDHGMSISDAVAAPRFSAPGEVIDLSARIPSYICDAVAARGYQIARSAQSFTVAKVHAILYGDGESQGAADPGGGGMALAV